jgi:hypothetical protein
MESTPIHLCKWQKLEVPKEYEGWGFRNIFDFSKSLAGHTLWRVINCGGIWHRVIKDKYLAHKTVTNWLRSSSFTQKASSKIWSGLLTSMHLILHWLSWDLGSGQLISLGNDRILGLDALSVLSQSLVIAFNQKHIYSIAQAINLYDSHHLCNYWLKSSDLDLSRDLASEWDQYRRALIDSDILLQDRVDMLM